MSLEKRVISLTAFAFNLAESVLKYALALNETTTPFSSTLIFVSSPNSLSSNCWAICSTMESLPSFKNGVPAGRGLKLAARLLNFIVSYLHDEKSKMKKQSRSVTKSP